MLDDNDRNEGAQMTPDHDNETTPPVQTSAVQRRRFLQLGGVGLGALALAACGGPSVESDSNNDTGGDTGSADAGASGSAAPKESSSGSSGSGLVSASDLDYTGVEPAKEIEFWSVHPGSSQPIEKELVDAYNASQSETKVKLVTAGKNYEDVATKFQTALASNKVPALVMVSDVWWFTYAINGNLIPIEAIAEAGGIDESDYVETFYDDYDYGDSHWAVPYARSTPVFYYNKDHFKSAGLPDRAPETWQEMDDFAKKLQGADLDARGVTNWAKPDNYLAWYYQNVNWGWGGAYSDEFDLSALTGEGMINSLEWMSTTMKSNGGYADITGNSQTDDLAAGTISVCVNSTGSIGSLTDNAKFDVGVGFMPGGPEETDNVCPTGGTGIGISMQSGAEQQLAAAKFLNWLTNAENTIKFAGFTGYLPVRKSADSAELTKESPLTQVAVDQLEHLHSQDWARVFITGGDLAIGQGIGQVIIEGKDPKSAMEDVQMDLQKTFDRDIKSKLSS